MSGTVLGRVLVVECGVLALTYVLLLGIAARRIIRRRRMASRIARARAALSAVAGGRALAPPELELLAGLPLGLRGRLVADLAASISGQGRTRLTALAADTGIVAAAERACRNRRWWRRLEGVRMLTMVGAYGDGAVPLIADRDPEVRAAAATWAADHPREDIIDGVVGMLDDPVPLCRFAAQGALLRIGGPAIEAITVRLEGAGLAHVDGALEVAAGLAGPRLLPAALVLATDASADTRARAAATIAAIGGAEAVAALERLLTDPQARVRAGAAAGLGRLGHWPAGPCLVTALGDPEWDVRSRAGLALAALGAPGRILLREAAEHHADRFARDAARLVLELPDTVIASAGP